MKKIKVALCLMLIPAFCTASKKKLQKEYNNLVSQCRTIAERIIRENSFEPIRQQAIIQQQSTNKFVENCIAERFGSKEFGSKVANMSSTTSINSLGMNLKTLEDQHNACVLNLIWNTIQSYLQTVGTPAARKLLADLIAGNLIIN